MDEKLKPEDMLPGETLTEAHERYLKESVWAVIRRVAGLIASIMEFAEGDRMVAKGFVEEHRGLMIETMKEDLELAMQVMWVLEEVFDEQRKS